MSTYHILNGDCLADQWSHTNINSGFIVCRECLIEGAVKAKDLSSFWDLRAEFMSDIIQF